MDIGGATPGSMPAQGRSIFEEGIRFPPVKLNERGKLAQPIVDILARNSRTPQETVADTLALAAATRAAELRVIELCERFGVDTYRATCDRLLERTRNAAQVMIDTFIPEEPLVFEDYVDDDGSGNGPFKIRLSLSRVDNKAILDFTGSSPQAEGPINLFMGENMFKMVTGIVLIMSPRSRHPLQRGLQRPPRDPIPAGLDRAARLPGAALQPRTRWRGSSTCSRGRSRFRTRSWQPAPRADRAPISSTRGTTRSASFSSSTKSTTGASRDDQSGTAWTSTPGGRTSRTSRSSTPRATSRCASSA